MVGDVSKSDYLLLSLYSLVARLTETKKSYTTYYLKLTLRLELTYLSYFMRFETTFKPASLRAVLALER